LTETLPRAADAMSAADIALAENDIFGDIFPLEEQSVYRARVVATSAVELVKISKPVLKATCYRYPRMRTHRTIKPGPDTQQQRPFLADGSPDLPVLPACGR
jgi:hypothetical protein